MIIRKLITTGAVAALLGIGAFAATATSADARTVCNRFGDCWHEDGDYHYPASLGVHFYSDDWRATHHWDNDNDWRWHHHHYYWREHHDGRGYWRNGIWITL